MRANRKHQSLDITEVQDSAEISVDLISRSLIRPSPILTYILPLVTLVTIIITLKFINGKLRRI